MPQDDSPIIVKPRFPQVIETYGGSAQGDSYALLTKKTIFQPSGSRLAINRHTEEGARVDVIFPDIPETNAGADGFVISVDEQITETFDPDDGKLIERITSKQEPLGKIAPDDYPYFTARIPSELTIEKWEYLNGVPSRREVTTRKPVVAVAGNYADFKQGEGLGLVLAAKTVETWTLQAFSTTESKYLHITQNYKTRGELYPEYVSKFSNWTVGLGLCLDPSSPEPEIVSFPPEPEHNDPSQPIVRETEQEETETYPDEPLEELPPEEYQPDGPLEPNQPEEIYNPDESAELPNGEENPNYDPTYDPESEEYQETPDPTEAYEPDSPPWEGKDFNNFDNPEEIFLDDAPDDPDLETVADTAADLARARQFPYTISHPMKRVDVTRYQPFRRADVAGLAFIRDGYAIALGEGQGGGKELAVSYTGLLLGRVNESGIVARTYRKVTSFEDAVVMSGQATLVDPAREFASASAINRVLVSGAANAIYDANWQRYCTGTIGGADAVKTVRWLGSSGSRTITVKVASGANLLSQSTIYIWTWVNTPPAVPGAGTGSLSSWTWSGATEIGSISSTGGTFNWNPPTQGNYLSFIVKVGNYRRGLWFHAGGNGIYIFGR